MAKFKFTLSIGFANASKTEKELIEEEYNMWASNSGWEQLETNDEEKE